MESPSLFECYVCVVYIFFLQQSQSLMCASEKRLTLTACLFNSQGCFRRAEFTFSLCVGVCKSTYGYGARTPGCLVAWGLWLPLVLWIQYNTVFVPHSCPSSVLCVLVLVLVSKLHNVLRPFQINYSCAVSVPHECCLFWNLLVLCFPWFCLTLQQCFGAKWVFLF